MNLRIISPEKGGREWGNEETWQAKAQKNRFIIEIHVISHLLLLSLADCQCVRPLSGSGSGQTHSSLGYLHISSYRWSWSWSWSWCATVAVCLQSPSAIELMPRGHLKIPRAFARRRVTHFYEVICVWSALNAAHHALRTPSPPANVFFFTALRKNRNQFLENVRLEKPKRNITHCNGKSIKIITRPVDLSEQANIFQVPFQILLCVLYVSVQK